MQGTSVLFGQVLTVFGIVVLGTWGATQWTAAQLGYQLRLGTPWFDFLGLPIYHPWRIFEWWYWFEAYAPRVFLKGRRDRGNERFNRLLRRYRDVDLARPAVQARHDLRLGQMGGALRDSQGRPVQSYRRLLGFQGRDLPSP